MAVSILLKSGVRPLSASLNLSLSRLWPVADHCICLVSPPESAAVSTIGKDPDPLADLKPPSEPLPVLIRATDGKGKSSRTDKSKKTDRRKVKLSTVVLQEELEGFFTKYTEVCKAGMSSGLKKRDRKAREKKKKKGKGGPSGSGDKT